MVEGPSLPPELVAEILSYLRTDPPTELDGLQVALTCRALYEEFKPLIVSFYVVRLVRAITPATRNLQVSLQVTKINAEGAGLLIDPDDFKRRVGEAFASASLDSLAQESLKRDPDSEFPNFEAEYRIEPHSLNDAPTVWGLASLLSKPHVAPRLRRFTLRWGVKRQIDPAPTAAWQRALLHLMQACVSIEGVELILMGALWWPRVGTLSPGIPLIGTLPPHFELPTFSNCRVSKLRFEGIGLTTLWRPHFHALLTQSAGTLTHLSISSSPHPPDSWGAVFSNEWGLHRLEHFEVTGTEVPFTVLVQFLLSYPSISSATLSIPQASQDANIAGHATLIQLEDYPRFLPNLQRLAGTLNILLALFDQSSSQDNERAHLIIPRLQTLTLLNEDNMSMSHDDKVQDYDDLTKLLSCLPGRSPTGAQGRPLLRTLELRIPYSNALERWLESASETEPSTPQEGEGIADGTWSLRGIASSLMNSSTASVPSRRHSTSLQSTLTFLPCISSLTLEFMVKLDNSTGYPPNYAIHPGGIATFISALPGLKDVVLDGAFYRPENAVKNAGELWQGLGKMWAECPKLERLEIRKIGGSFTPAVWRRGEEEPTPGFDFNDWAAAFLMVI